MKEMGWMAWTGLIWLAAGRGLARVQRSPFRAAESKGCKMTILKGKNVQFCYQPYALI